MNHKIMILRAQLNNYNTFKNETILSIKAPAVIINGDRDVILAEHALKMSKLIKNFRLMFLPSAHGFYIGVKENPESEGRLMEMTLNIIENFLGN